MNINRENLGYDSEEAKEPVPYLNVAEDLRGPKDILTGQETLLTGLEFDKRTLLHKQEILQKKLLEISSELQQVNIAIHKVDQSIQGNIKSN